jgi:hypothetical protein
MTSPSPTVSLQALGIGAGLLVAGVIYGALAIPALLSPAPAHAVLAARAQSAVQPPSAQIRTYFPPVARQVAFLREAGYRVDIGDVGYRVFLDPETGLLGDGPSARAVTISAIPGRCDPSDPAGRRFDGLPQTCAAVALAVSIPKPLWSGVRAQGAWVIVPGEGPDPVGIFSDLSSFGPGVAGGLLTKTAFLSTIDAAMDALLIALKAATRAPDTDAGSASGAARTGDAVRFW